MARSNHSADRSDQKRSIFKPRTKERNFLLSVLVTAVHLTVILAVCLGLAGVGAVIGIAKAYMDTAPDLDLAALRTALCGCGCHPDSASVSAAGAVQMNCW